MEKLNKRAQMGQTLTWVVATFIIFAMLFIFVMFSAFLVESKKGKSYFSPGGVEISKQDFQDVASFKSFESFVNLNINGARIYNIVANPDGSLTSEFKGAAEGFLKSYLNSWIRIYQQEDKVSYSNSGFSDYSAGGSCNPDTGDLSAFYFGNNKIILCKNEP